MCPLELWLQFLISVTTDQWLCWSVVGRDWPSRYALCLWDPPNPRSERILLQSTPDSIIDGIYVRTVRRPDRRLDEVGYVLLQKLDRYLRPVRQWRYTVFPIVFPAELGCFRLFYPIKITEKIFARNSHILLRIDYFSTCVIHFKCTLLLEDIISWHVGGRFFMAHSVYSIIPLIEMCGCDWFTSRHVV